MSNSEDKEKIEVFKLEEIIDRKWDKNILLYKVKWSGFSQDQSTWEPISNLVGFEKEIGLYEDKEFKIIYKNGNENKSKTRKNKKNKASSKKNKKKNPNDNLSNNLNVTIPSTEKSIEKEKENKKINSSLNRKRKSVRRIENFIDLTIKDHNRPLSNKGNLSSKEPIFEKEKKTIVKKTEPKKFEDIPGKIDKDSPVKILYCKSKNENNNQKLFLIEWDKNKSGFVPDPSYVNYEIIKEKYPKLLIDYIESKIDITDL